MKKTVQYLVVLLLIMSNNVYSQDELKVVTGKVYNLETNKELSQVKVSLFDQDQKKVAESPVNSQGFYFFELEGINDAYRVQVQAENYTTAEVAVKFSTGNPTSRINFGLNEIKKGNDLATVLNLAPIYFDFNSSYLNEKNKRDLEPIIEILKANPTMRIEVRAHADSRGSSNYNLWLSERRARRTAEWIVNHGKIDSNRIATKDYGKEQLANDCPSGSRCTEQMHRENRRCEFIVL